MDSKRTAVSFTSVPALQFFISSLVFTPYNYENNEDRINYYPRDTAYY